VFYLQNATAAELAKVLTVLPGKNNTKNKGKAPAISQNVKILADEETNALIITASRDEYSVLEEVIKKLDIPRRMVYLEALIMEVDTDKQFDVGVQWAAGGVFSDGTGQLATGFSGNTDPPFDMISGIVGDNPVLPTGFSLGILKQGIKIGGVTFPNIAAILRAYKTDSAINIISTPQILTTDNKEAEISVGENVPYITSQNTTAGDQDYTQYEYKDVSTKLTITPHINQAETLRLEIATEIVKLKGKDPADKFRPTTYKRTAKTTVIVNNGDTVVIGGIIGQDAVESEWKIPLLGDIPWLGWLFKTHTTTSTKTNMFIFVTPHIIKNPADLAAVTLQKEDSMGKVLPAVQQELHKKPNKEHALTLATTGYEKLMADKVQEAKQYFQEALTIDPENPFALMNLGVVYEKEEKPGKALQMYRAVLNLGTEAVASESSDPEKNGMSLLEIARENIGRLQEDSAKEERK
jgi:general secretion pathway protein D